MTTVPHEIFAESARREAGKSIGIWRRTACMRQSELAEMLGMSRISVTNWERCASLPGNPAMALLVLAGVVDKEGFPLLPSAERQRLNTGRSTVPLPQKVRPKGKYSHCGIDAAIMAHKEKHALTSMRKLAKHIGVNPSSLIHWADGSGMPRKEGLVKLLTAGVITEDALRNLILYVYPTLPCLSLAYHLSDVGLTDAD